MLMMKKKYANAEKVYDAHPVLVEAKADQKQESLRQAPVERGNRRN